MLSRLGCEDDALFGLTAGISALGGRVSIGVRDFSRDCFDVRQWNIFDRTPKGLPDL